MYRFLGKPRWVLMHAVVLVLIGLFALAGKWQLDRLHQRRAHNALVRAGERAPVRPLRDVASSPYRRASVSGRYDTQHESLLIGRARDDVPGNHVLTPLITADDHVVLVDRGWVPAANDRPPVRVAAPPSGRVTVTGVLLPTENEGPFAPKRESTSRVVSKLDVARLLSGIDKKPYTTTQFLLLASQRPKQGSLPKPAPLPPLDDGPHLSYAIQWLLFIVIAIAGYATVIRREAKRRSGTVAS